MVGYLYIFFALIMSFVFSQMINPVILALLVVGTGVLVIIFLGQLLPLCWFRYVVLLTFLGGLLIIFVYMASLCPNEPITKFSWWGVVGGVGLIGIHYSWWRVRDFLYPGALREVRILLKIYYSGMVDLICLLVVYLLLILFVVVDLRLVSEGSLRVKYGEWGSKC